MENKRSTEIIRVNQLASDVFDMWVRDEEIANNGKPGQFASLYCNNEIRLLPRPISICEINKKEGLVRFVYRAIGEGTKEFSKLKVSDKIQILGPLGNGFKLEGKNVLIVGGGIGIPPLLELAKQLYDLDANINFVLGYKDEVFLQEDFEQYGKVYISTEDGSRGTKGNVIECISANNLVKALNSNQDVDLSQNIDINQVSDIVIESKVDMIFSCGPIPMLKGLKEFANKNNIMIQISLEERMGCGVGACLSCVCKTKEKQAHTNIHNTRICTEGPVFNANEVEI